MESHFDPHQPHQEYFDGAFDLSTNSGSMESAYAEGNRSRDRIPLGTSPSGLPVWESFIPRECVPTANIFPALSPLGKKSSSAAPLTFSSHKSPSPQRNYYTEEESGASFRAVDDLVRENKWLREKYEQSRSSQMKDRYYFSQYTKLLLDAQEAGMRRECLSEEKTEWAELMLSELKEKICIEDLIKKKALEMETAQFCDIRSPNYDAFENSSSRGLTRSCDPVFGSPTRSLSPGFRKLTAVNSPRYRSSRTPERSEVNAASSIPRQTEASSNAGLREQRALIQELQLQVETTEGKLKETLSELSCERALTAEMQEELDDLVASELLHTEKVERSLLETEYWESLVGLNLTYFRFCTNKVDAYSQSAELQGSASLEMNMRRCMREELARERQQFTFPMMKLMQKMSEKIEKL